MRLTRLPLLSSSQIEKGMIIEDKGVPYLVCRPIENAYQHPTEGVISNILRNKFWTVPISSPDLEPKLSVAGPCVKKLKIYTILP